MRRRHRAEAEGPPRRRPAGSAPWASRGACAPLLASLGALLLGSACGNAAADDSEVHIALLVQPDPPQVGPAQVIVQAYEPDGSALTGATIELEANMNHAGMVPVFADTEEAAPGRYEAELEFTMGGDWFVIVRTTLADGEETETILDVSGVRPAGE